MLSSPPDGFGNYELIFYIKRCSTESTRSLNSHFISMISLGESLNKWFSDFSSTFGCFGCFYYWLTLQLRLSLRSLRKFEELSVDCLSVEKFCYEGFYQGRIHNGIQGFFNFFFNDFFAGFQC